MKTLIIALIIVILPVAASGMSDKDYRRYQQDNAYKIYSTKKFNEEQIRRMQDKHDKAVKRHYRSRERDKERKHQLEIIELRNIRPAQPPEHQPPPAKKTNRLDAKKTF